MLAGRVGSGGSVRRALALAARAVRAKTSTTRPMVKVETCILTMGTKCETLEWRL